MTPLLRPLLALPLLLAPAPLAAQDAVVDVATAFYHAFSPQRLSRLMIQWIIGGLRTQMEITYQGLTVTPDGREAYLIDVVISPTLPWDMGRDCAISVSRIDISESGGQDDLSIHLEFIGASATPQCMEPGAADLIAVAGYEQLEMERLFVDIDYVFSTSSLNATLHAAIRDAIVVEAAAELDYVWLRSTDPYVTGHDMEPVIGLSGLEVRVEDAGALAALRPILPTMGIKVETLPAMVEGGLREALAPGEGQSIPANTAAFIGNVGLAAEAFFENGGAITIAARPGRTLWLGPESMNAPDVLLDALSLDASAGPLRARGGLDPALILAALGGGAGGMNPDEIRTVGGHLMLNLGGPKAAGAGRALLAPLADSGDPAAALILAQALAATDPDAAYRRGLFAASELPGVLALLDEAEAVLPLAAIFEAQDAAASPDADSRDAALIEAAEIAGLRRAALAYMVGDGPARNYRRAYFIASLAAAAGDRASTDLRARLAHRLSVRGDADAALWAKTTADLADEAFTIWTAGGLAAKLAP